MTSRYSVSLGSILHPTDFSHGSELAFVHALRLASATRGRLTILHVDPQGGAPDWNQYPAVRDTLHRWQLLPDHAHRSAVAQLGLDITKASIGDSHPSTGVLRYLEQHPADLIVLATHQRQGLARWLHREIAGQINQRFDGAALLIPYGSEGFVDPQTGISRLRRILLPADVLPHPQPAVELTADVLAALGSADCSVRLLHVGDPARQPAIQVPSAGQVDWQWVHRSGPVVDTILSEADALAADLIVMTTAGRHGFLDALRGSTTEQIVQRSRCPVLAVHAWDE